MAQIKKITVSLTEDITLAEGYQFAWVKNTGSETLYISGDHSVLNAGGQIFDKGVAEIKAGEATMVTIPHGILYCYSESSTTAEVHAQGIPTCPFKVGGTTSSGGGGSSKIDYSLTEQNTGVKWVDGKAVYQRTFELDYDEQSGHNWIICPTTGINNVMRVEAVDTANKRCLGGIDGVNITSDKIDDTWYFVVDTFFKYVTFWYTKK